MKKLLYILPLLLIILITSVVRCNYYYQELYQPQAYKDYAEYPYYRLFYGGESFEKIYIEGNELSEDISGSSAVSKDLVSFLKDCEYVVLPQKKAYFISAFIPKTCAVTSMCFREDLRDWLEGPERPEGNRYSKYVTDQKNKIKNGTLYVWGDKVYLCATIITDTVKNPDNNIVYPGFYTLEIVCELKGDSVSSFIESRSDYKSSLLERYRMQWFPWITIAAEIAVYFIVVSLLKKRLNK